MKAAGIFDTGLEVDPSSGMTVVARGAAWVMRLGAGKLGGKPVTARATPWPMESGKSTATTPEDPENPGLAVKP